MGSPQLKNVSVLDVLIFTSYVLLWAISTLLIRGSRGEDGNYPFEFQSVVLFTEVTKFVIALCLHFMQFPLREYPFRVKEVVLMWRNGLYFLVPAFIYLVYNLLLYYNLAYFDPVSYKVLINNRIVWSGLLFQFFFSKRLGLQKWIALLILMTACVVNQMSSSYTFDVNLWYVFVLAFQGFTSSLGGVYNEVLLKQENDIPFHMKNAYLYMFSIIMNMIIIQFTKPDLFWENPPQLLDGFSWGTWVLVFMGAICGFSTSFMLKHLNIILKEFAHSTEIILVAVGYCIFFGQTLGMNVITSMFLCIFSVLLYSGTVRIPFLSESQAVLP